MKTNINIKKILILGMVSFGIIASAIGVYTVSPNTFKSISADFFQENTSLKDVTVFLSDTPSPVSTNEAFRERTEELSNTLVLGYLNALTENETFQKKFETLSHRSDIVLHLSPEKHTTVSTGEVFRVSSDEIMRDPQYPFLSVSIFSTTEAQRVQAEHAIKTLRIVPSFINGIRLETIQKNTPSFAFSFSTKEASRSLYQFIIALQSEGTIPSGVLLQLHIDTDILKKNTEWNKFFHMIHVRGTTSGATIHIISEQKSSCIFQSHQECTGEECSSNLDDTYSIENRNESCSIANDTLEHENTEDKISSYFPHVE